MFWWDAKSAKIKNHRGRDKFRLLGSDTDYSATTAVATCSWERTWRNKQNDEFIAGGQTSDIQFLEKVSVEERTKTAGENIGSSYLGHEFRLEIFLDVEFTFVFFVRIEGSLQLLPIVLAPHFNLTFFYRLCIWAPATKVKGKGDLSPIQTLIFFFSERKYYYVLASILTLRDVG